ncbi:MAG: PolC-type DNA polymerase III [Clostridiales bacterium]|nr:PolC-type DNA polymerase III [Clostridiales bacterium]
MEGVQRTLFDVFPGAFDGRDCEELLDGATVDRVTISKEQMTVSVHMSVRQLMPPALEEDIRESLDAYLRQRMHIDIHIHYPTVDLEEGFEEYRSHIQEHIAEESPILGRFLEDSAWERDGDVIHIRIPESAESLIKEKKAEKLLEEQIEEETGRHMAVRFISCALTQEERAAAAEKAVDKEASMIRRGMMRVQQEEAETAQDEEVDLPWEDPVETGTDQVLLGKPIQGPEKPLSFCDHEAKGVILRGILRSTSTHEIKGGKIILTMTLTDYERSVTAKAFIAQDVFQKTIESRLKSGQTIAVKGAVKEDSFLHDWVLMANHITICAEELAVDPAVKEAAEQMIIGTPFSGAVRPIRNIENTTGTVIIHGDIITSEEKELRSGAVMMRVDLTDYTGSIPVKMMLDADTYKAKKGCFKKGKQLRVQGEIQEDEFAHEKMLTATAALPENGQIRVLREDHAEEKRVELHAHTQISEMDAVDSPTALVKQAIAWGHPAVAITDHGVVQGFPDAMTAAGDKIKVLYGVEAYLVDDLMEAVIDGQGQDFSDTFTVFDIETTGIHKESDHIIEIGAVRVENGLITDRFSRFINPGIPIPEQITELTSITDADVQDADPIEIVLRDFLAWVGDSVLVAHNAMFDTGFVKIWAERIGMGAVPNTIMDTLVLARGMYTLRRYTLDSVAKHLEVSLEHHHRAVDDAEATAEIFLHMIAELQEQGLTRLDGINTYIHDHTDIKRLRSHHAVILVQSQAGMRNLYELISLSHLNYYYRQPRIPKSEFLRLREGLLIGSACEAGELFRAVLEQESPEVIERLVNFYDYLEIQPIGNNAFLVREGTVPDEEGLRDLNRKIVALGEQYGKPVAATCDVHFLEPEDEVYRRILMFGKGFEDADQQAPLYFRTTEEMLEEFSYLGPEKAREVVIETPRKIADSIDWVKPIPDGTYTPEIPNAIEELQEISYKKAKSMYGDPLPKVVEDRLDRELTSIIKNGFASLYIFAQRLVWKSNADGYLVGSRGSVGSSFAATMAGITEVNPLPPHYYCKKCQYNEFDSPEIRAAAGLSGFDLPDKVCPVCGEMLVKQGQEIPFETFLGFDGDKEPDIDLNFSGEYQPHAWAYTEELFGKGQVFRAGTMGTLAEKTAYGYVKKYMTDHHLTVNTAEINRLVAGCTGVKRTTGQHPGGQMIVPKGYSIYQFSPVQHPANDMTTDIVTTHFDYHQIKGRLLKMDILGHDDPTMIRMLEDLTGLPATEIPLDNKEVMSLFLGTEALGVTPEEINSPVGTFGIPEFGTQFVRQMLVDTKPKAFSDLVRISGLSHGTDVWNNNAKDLIDQGIVGISECICTRDDIMTYLIHKNMDSLESFKIMESVRKGKGLTPQWEEDMRAHDVPEWYIGSCKKIKYMFPKAHAAAYVTMSLRVAYYKVFYKEAYYAAYYTVRADGFDYDLMCNGLERAREAIREIDAKDKKDTTAKDKEIRTILELVVEMYCRGLEFVPIDLYKSDSTHFIITEDKKLLPPFNSISGMGLTAAESIVEARKDGEFTTIEDLLARTKVSRTIVDLMKQHGFLDGLPETDQMSLF